MTPKHTPRRGCPRGTAVTLNQPLGTGSTGTGPALSAPAQHGRTDHSSSVSLYRHSLGDLQAGTEMDFLTPEVLLQCHHQILVCDSSVDSPQIPVRQDFQVKKINNICHLLSLKNK